MRNDINDEMKIHGFHASMAVFAQRPDAIIRVYLTKNRLKEATLLLKWASRAKKAYHVVETDDLTKITGTPHHEGLAVLTRRSAALSFADLTATFAGQNRPILMIYCDGVANPHNLGSMLRTAAHFGVAFMIGPKGRLPELSPAIYRVAEGAAEFVKLIHLDRPAEQLEILRSSQGFKLYGTSSYKGESLFGAKLSPRAIMILGAEGGGVSAGITQMCDGFFKIPGTGQVESLNVGVACGLILGEFYRQTQAP